MITWRLKEPWYAGSIPGRCTADSNLDSSTMLPKLWEIPIVGLDIKSYGFMLMLGFLVSIWFAMRRALRVKADPDLILNVGFVSLICGVAGARVFFVAHYWTTDFAWQENPLWAAINISAGGLEYYGGLLGAILGTLLYLRFVAKFRAVGDDLEARPKRRPSLRLYLDILAPAVMMGLAFGRAGCFLNGCCWGGVCVHEEHADQTEPSAALPWAMTFPFASGAHFRQWESRQLAVPAELIYDNAENVNAPYLLFGESLTAPDEEIDGPVDRLRELRRRRADAAGSGADAAEMAGLDQEIEATTAEITQLAPTHFTVLDSMRYASRRDPGTKMSKRELAELARQHRSLPVHPAQLYGLINAALLSLFLSCLFYRRKRHGVVFGLMLVLYPITRVVLELIRVDNPLDTVGLTISQAVSLGVCAVGVAYLIGVCTRLPLRSERALAFAPLPSEPKKKS